MKLLTNLLGFNSLIFLVEDLTIPGETSSKISSLLGSLNSFLFLSLSELLVDGVLRFLLGVLLLLSSLSSLKLLAEDFLNFLCVGIFSSSESKLLILVLRLLETDGTSSSLSSEVDMFINKSSCPPIFHFLSNLWTGKQSLAYYKTYLSIIDQ